MELEKLTSHSLRAAIWQHRVSFPSQIPIFEKQARADIQWRLVLLYFIHRWPLRELGKRYHLTPQRITQIVDKWRIRAIALGYIQEIPGEEPLPSHSGAESGEASELPRAS